MTTVVSIINLKGGVAKTTTTVQLAECLASEFSKKVLVIDLDPQTNATIALIGEERWDELDKQKQTLFYLLSVFSFCSPSLRILFLREIRSKSKCLPTLF